MPAPAKSKANPTGRRGDQPKGKKNKTYASKTAPRGPITASAIQKPQAELPFELQQLVLNIFKDAFPLSFGDGLEELLQEVKGKLFERDFMGAFGRDDYLEAYVVRWSPSRALGYLEILSEVIEKMLEEREELGNGSNEESDAPAADNKASQELKIACLGGGAGAEIVSLAGVLNLLPSKSSVSSAMEALEIEEETSDVQEKDSQQKPLGLHINIDLIDIANWKSITNTLHTTLTTPPPISKYASASVKASQKPLVRPEDFTSTFHQHDLMNLSPDTFPTLLGNQDLITILFTLNELYTTSLPKTQSFLLSLTKAVKPGTLLLVVDSAGSYSAISLNGKGEKMYPMHWLLDHTLLAGEAEEKKWSKVKEEESRWFRINEELKYKLELEDMRCQIHVYRRI